MALRLGVPVVLGLCLGAVVACSSSDGGGGGGSGASGGSGGGGNDCFPTAAECYGPQGPSGPGHECQARADNTGQKVWSGRLTQIQVAKPAALATQFLQETIIDKGVNLNQPACNSNGLGTFNWLFEFDSQTNKLTMGGGLPITDPSKPACYAVLPNAQIPVGPTTIDVTVTGNQFSASNIDIVVPIFVTPTDTTNIVLLPIHGGEFTGTWSTDHNCIGAYNGDKLDPAIDCLPDTKSNPPVYSWTNGGGITGYITIDEADQVFVPDIGQSLCVLLAGTSWKGPDGYCKTSTKWTGGARPEGDWCKATNAAATATCKDSYRLEAGFAASAYPISGNCP